MSMSLRDQLLKAGLVSQKQVKEAERQQDRRARQPPKQKAGSPPAREPARSSEAAKTARDQALNRQQQEKAAKKALFAQIKQLIDQNRLPPIEGEDFYNFLDGNKIRRVAVNPELRGRIGRGEVVIVRHGGRYDLVPPAIAARIRERDQRAVIAPVAAAAMETSPAEDPYAGFVVPDDMIW